MCSTSTGGKHRTEAKGSFRERKTSQQVELKTQWLVWSWHEWFNELSHGTVTLELFGGEGGGRDENKKPTIQCKSNKKRPSKY